MKVIFRLYLRILSDSHNILSFCFIKLLLLFKHSCRLKRFLSIWLLYFLSFFSSFLFFSRYLPAIYFFDSSFWGIITIFLYFFNHSTFLDIASFRFTITSSSWVILFLSTRLLTWDWRMIWSVTNTHTA